LSSFEIAILELNSYGSSLDGTHVFLVNAESSTECIVAKSEEEMSSWKMSISQEIRTWLENNAEDEEYRRSIPKWQDEKKLWQACAPPPVHAVTKLTAEEFEAQRTEATANALAQLLAENPELSRYGSGGTPSNKKSRGVFGTVFSHLSPRRGTPRKSNSKNSISNFCTCLPSKLEGQTFTSYNGSPSIPPSSANVTPISKKHLPQSNNTPATSEVIFKKQKSDATSPKLVKKSFKLEVKEKEKENDMIHASTTVKDRISDNKENECSTEDLEYCTGNASSLNCLSATSPTHCMKHSVAKEQSQSEERSKHNAHRHHRKHQSYRKTDILLPQLLHTPLSPELDDRQAFDEIV